MIKSKITELKLNFSITLTDNRSLNLGDNLTAIDFMTAKKPHFQCQEEAVLQRVSVFALWYLLILSV